MAPPGGGGPPSGSPLSRPAPRRWWRALLPLVAYTGLSLLHFRAVWVHPTTSFIGGGADPEQTMWFLAWIPHALTHHLNPLVTDHLNHPVGLNVMWNTSLPLAGLVLWPLTVVAGPMVAYNLLMTACPALSGWFAYLAIRRYVPSQAAAAIGGLLYGFSPYMMAQSLGHANLVTAFLPPLILIVLDDILVRQRRPWWLSGTVLGLLIVAQLLLGEELLAGTALASAVAVTALCIQHRDRLRAHLPHAWRALAVAAAAGLALAAWPLAVQFLGPERPGGPLQARDVFVSDLLGFVVPGSTQRLAPDWALRISNSFTGNASERDAYIGLPLAALLLLTLIRCWRVPVVRVMGSSALVLCILSLGEHLHIAGRRSPFPLPWYILDRIPLLGQALPNRLMLFVYLFGGTLLAVLLHRLHSGPGGYRRAVPVALAAAALLPLVPAAAAVTSPAAAQIPAYFRAGGGVESLPSSGAILVLPFPTGLSPAPILWQAAAGVSFRMLGGYWIGPVPEHTAVPTLRDALVAIDTTGVAPRLDDALQQRLMTELHAAGVRAVVAGPSRHHDLEVALMTALLRRQPQSTGGVLVWPALPPEGIEPSSTG